MRLNPHPGGPDRAMRFRRPLPGPVAWLFMVFLSALLPAGAAAATISAEELRAAVLSHVEKNHPWPAGRVRSVMVTRLADAVFPQGAVSFTVSNDPNEDFIGDTPFSIRYQAGAAVVREETVRVSIEVLTDVVVAARELVRGRQICQDDVAVQKKWLRKIPVNVATDPAEVVGKSLAFTVKPNGEIPKSGIRNPLLIKRGSVVRIVFDNDLFSVSAMGVSEEDGPKDKVIRVKNLSSNRVIYARVTAESLVKVEY